MTAKDPRLAVIDAQIKALKTLEAVDLECRIGAGGHRWHYVKPDWKPNSAGVVAVMKQCERCTTIVRSDVSKRYGELLAKPRYQYPDGYQLQKLDHRIQPQAVRAVWLQTLDQLTLPDAEKVFRNE